MLHVSVHAHEVDLPCEDKLLSHSDTELQANKQAVTSLCLHVPCTSNSRGAMLHKATQKSLTALLNAPTRRELHTGIIYMGPNRKLKQVKIDLLNRG